jgi:hypothetical protein
MEIRRCVGEFELKGIRWPLAAYNVRGTAWSLGAVKFPKLSITRTQFRTVIATLGTIGFEGRFDYAAIGTVSNVASRLCDEPIVDKFSSAREC